MCDPQFFIKLNISGILLIYLSFFNRKYLHVCQWLYVGYENINNNV